MREHHVEFGADDVDVVCAAFVPRLGPIGIVPTGGAGRRRVGQLRTPKPLHVVR